MVSLKVSRSWLMQKLSVTEAELIEALPNIKVEVDENNELLEVEVTGDRPDLLSRQGILRALKGWFEQEKGLPLMKVSEAKTEVIVNKNVEAVRPIVLTAFARGLKFDGESIANLMQVQEKLVLTHGRHRKKVAVGIHDAQKIVAPFSYEAVTDDYEFTPLGWSEPTTIKRILTEHDKGVEYAHCFKNSNTYPLLKDAKGVVSFPPIINSKRTAVTDSTIDLLIDVTGTDLEACQVALNILCQDFFDDGANIEAIKVKGVSYPNTSEQRQLLLGIEYCNKVLGTDLSDDEIIHALLKQRITASKNDGGVIACTVPRYRADFLHQIDLVEEVALGYGFNSFELKKPNVYTKGSLSVETIVENTVRDSLVGAGFLETNLIVLSSEEKAYNSLLETKGIIKIKNPMSNEYGVLRSYILSSLLDVLANNTHEPYPQKLFEVGEVVRKINGEAKTLKSVSAISCHANAGLTEIASILQVMFSSLNKGFELRKSELNNLMVGRQAEVFVDNKCVGFVGEVHPQVLENFGINSPCACFEVEL